MWFTSSLVNSPGVGSIQFSSLAVETVGAVVAEDSVVGEAAAVFGAVVGDSACATVVGAVVAGAKVGAVVAAGAVVSAGSLVAGCKVDAAV